MDLIESATIALTIESLAIYVFVNECSFIPSCNFISEPLVSSVPGNIDSETTCPLPFILPHKHAFQLRKLHP